MRVREYGESRKIPVIRNHVPSFQAQEGLNRKIPITMAVSQPSLLYLAVHLERAEHRLSSLLRQAERFGIPIQLVPAIDGGDLTDKDLWRYDQKRRHAEFTSDLLPNEHACILSHCKALEVFLRSGADYGVILEDDMALHPLFNEGIAWLTRHTSGWECIKLFNEHGSLSSLTPLMPDAPVQLVFPRKVTCVAVGNLYTREGALRVLEGFDYYWKAYDTWWGELVIRRRIPVCGVFPSLVYTLDPDNKHSTIDEDCVRSCMVRDGKQGRTMRQWLMHRACSWRLSWGKWRMRTWMKRRLCIH